MHSLNIRNVSEEFMLSLKKQAIEQKMHLRDFCIMLLEEGVKDRSKQVPWVGGNRDIDPNNPEDVAAWKERDRQAAAMLEPAGIATNVVFAPPEMNFPVVGFTDTPDKTQKARVIQSKEGTMIISQDIPREEVERIADRVAEHFTQSHVLSSADPKPRVVEAAASMKPVNQIQKLCPKCKREKMKVRDETTLRCSLCGYQEARC